MNSPAPAQGGLRALLRAQTHEQHKLLDAQLSLTGEQLTRAHYTAYLRGMLGFLEPVENTLRASAAYRALIPDAAERCRSALLRADLVHLDAIPPEPRRPAMTPPMRSLAQQVGVAYVMEGSTLGGRYLARALAGSEALADSDALAQDRSGDDDGGPSSDGDADAPGLRFLRGYGADTKARWADFVARIDAAPWNDIQRGQAVFAARATFELLLAWLPHRHQAPRVLPSQP
ncbi:biliverdin-producing heme oxygenase [Haliangium ochraceum]|uniref:Heme oxygenase-like protein n=1 Tax=Haliangium ochraceum (strain DSM 14365 / JCM 11303 / SMP-2) TaxID=502025 RepID=D0LRI9_HALO1|nr:biliverdin-producing heme oxygenase [Haliangium ochraceum]ACY17217.1 Heme oxygenase-like protein [Haliangium ochraceum DSM 14365]